MNSLANSPTPEQIEQARIVLRSRIVRTPVLPLITDPIAAHFCNARSAFIKLELFQHAGSFKARGNLLGIDRLDDAQRASGVVAASGGNHALAVSWAARERNIRATLVMPEATDPARITGCRELGAQVVLVHDIAAAFAEMNRISADEGCTIMHPFEGEHMTLGAASCGAEILEDIGDIDLMIVAVGGGGLIGGIAAALKQARPECDIIGVEPMGADSLYRSFEAGKPVAIDRVESIADSLGSPTAMPYSYAVARQYVSRIVRIGDDRILEAMRLMRDGLNIMAEPACAAALAAATGPLQEDLVDRNVCVLACGSNIGADRYRSLVGN
jgi:threonine dehydratase